MAHLNQDFKVTHKHRWFIWTVILTFFVCFLALFIVTSFYKYDWAISKFFVKGMDIPFVKGWADYTVLDGYNLIVSFVIPIVCLIFECVYAYFKAQHRYVRLFRNLLKVVYGICIPLEVILMGLIIPFVSFQDKGFGIGFDFEYLIGWRYLIPIYVVSFVINLVMCYLLMGFVHFNLAKRKDFLDCGYFKWAWITLLVIAMLYIPMAVMKDGFGRPHPFRVDWHEWLQKIKEVNPDGYAQYIGQSDINYGWHDLNNPSAADLSLPNGSEWPWYKVGKGFFNKNTSYYANMPVDNDFPSGHFNELIICAVALHTVFRNPTNKKEHAYHLTTFSLDAIWLLAMFFAMLVNQGHWASDMAFSVVWALPGYFIAVYLGDWVYKGWKLAAKKVLEIPRKNFLQI